MASEDLLKKAVAAFNALSPEQQAEMLEEQRQSWVRGNVGLSRDERGMTSPVMPHPTTVMASELEPCPFCSKTMMLRSALWPSEGDADAIIHADPTDCPMLGFSDGSADGSIIEKWNCSLSNEDDFPSDGSCVRCGSVPRNANGLCNTCLDEDAERLENTRPTPVAPVSPDATGEPWPYQKTFNAIAAATRLESGCIFISVKDFVEAFGPTPDATGKCGELVTVLWGNARSLSQPHDPVVWERVCASYPRPYYTVELVTRSQAEELLAAERAKKEMLAESLHIQIKRVNELEADNAALNARVKELEAERSEWSEEFAKRGLAEASEGRALARIADLEAKLAAAQKALEPFADIADLVDAETEGMAETDELILLFHDYEFAKWPVSLFRKARAVLRGEL